MTWKFLCLLWPWNQLEIRLKKPEKWQNFAENDPENPEIGMKKLLDTLCKSVCLSVSVSGRLVLLVCDKVLQDRNIFRDGLVLVWNSFLVLMMGQFLKEILFESFLGYLLLLFLVKRSKVLCEACFVSSAYFLFLRLPGRISLHESVFAAKISPGI